MKNNNLTLKNIYRLLCENDYPIYSDSVIPASQRKGLTLLSFWQQLLLYRWKDTPHGKMIWRTSGSRNRYPSEICNRSASFSFYQVYTEEILEQISPEEIAEQAELFAGFLTQRNYRTNILRRRLTFFLPLAAEQDTLFSSETAGYLQKALALYDDPNSTPVLLDSWFLAMLTLHATAGSSMNADGFRSLRNNQEYDPDRVFINRGRSYKDIARGSVDLLTSRNCEIWQSALSPDHFYGREKEMFDLIEAVRQNRKLLLSGIGGCGKTELLRQLMRRILSDKLGLKVATIQYENSLVESFARSFLNLTGSKAQERFRESIYILSSNTDQPVLVMIDNMNNADEDDNTIRLLSSLPCSVLVSSRLNSLPGFDTYKIPEPDQKASALIFRSNSERILSEGEKLLLHSFLEKTHLRHPLTLMILGKSSNAPGLKMEDLFAGFNTQWFQSDDSSTVEHYFRGIYKKLYSVSGLTKSELLILKTLSILPYHAYQADDILEFTFSKSDKTGLSWLENLNKKGWLEHTDDGFGMHPVIAESIRKEHPKEQDFECLWTALIQRLGFSFRELGITETPQADTALLFLYALNHISAPISPELARCAGQAGLLLNLSAYADLNLVFLSIQIIQKSRLVTDELSCYIELLYLISENPHIEKGEKLVQQQTSAHSIPDELFHIFYAMLASGYCSLGQFDYIEQIYEDLISKNISEFVRLTAIASLAESFTLRHFRERAEQLLSDMIPTFDTNTKTGRFAVVYLSLQAGQNIAWMGNINEAKRYLNQADAVYGKIQKTLQITLMRLNLMADICLQENDLINSASYLEEALQKIKIYSGIDNISYMTELSKIAVLYHKMANKTGYVWFKKSYAYFEQVISVGEKLFGENPNLLIFLNNYAVALLDGDEPDRALPYLERAYALADGQAPIAKAEPAWNLSRVFRSKNNKDMELRYLKEALPVFEQFYGPDHEKTVKACSRLLILEGGQHTE